MSTRAFTQSPREVRARYVNFTCWLGDSETLVGADATVTPPKVTPVQGYVPPAFDQRIVEIATGGWVLDGVQKFFPLVMAGGVSVAAIASQYLSLFDGDVPMRPGVDFFTHGTQIEFATAPAGGELFWATLQNPIAQGEQRDVFADPPYSAFDVQAYVVAPDNVRVMLVSQGGSAPLSYKVKLLAETSTGQRREVRLDYQIREP